MKKRTILTYVLCGMASICFAHTQTGDTLRSISGRDSLIRETVFVHDTVYLQAPKTTAKPEDIIRTKAIGRYDRGIIKANGLAELRHPMWILTVRTAACCSLC